MNTLREHLKLHRLNLMRQRARECRRETCKARRAGGSITALLRGIGALPADGGEQKMPQTH